MRKVDTIRKQIQNLQKELESIQEKCLHPKHLLHKVNRSDVGNYDPLADCYWTEFHCDLCDKRWSEDQ